MDKPYTHKDFSRVFNYNFTPYSGGKGKGRVAVHFIFGDEHMIEVDEDIVEKDGICEFEYGGWGEVPLKEIFGERRLENLTRKQIVQGACRHLFKLTLLDVFDSAEFGNPYRIPYSIAQLHMHQRLTGDNFIDLGDYEKNLLRIANENHLFIKLQDAKDCAELYLKNKNPTTKENALNDINSIRESASNVAGVDFNALEAWIKRIEDSLKDSPRGYE